LKTRRIKLKPKNIDKKNASKIHIRPFDNSRDSMYFSMQTLKQMLPQVVVKGYTSISRAVINKKQDDDSKHELLVEGYGLKSVMMTPGIDFT